MKVTDENPNPLVRGADPDLDPCQNVTDPQTLPVEVFFCLLINILFWQAMARQYREKVETELREICNDVLALLDKETDHIF